MRIFLSLAMLLSFSVIAQEEKEYKYEPEMNQAEYYIGHFNKGKDLEDLQEWYGKFAEWAESQGSTYDNMTVALLTPIYHSDLTSLDVIWANNWPDQIEQYAGLEAWVKGGQELLKKLPVTNHTVTSTSQMVVSSPTSVEAGATMLTVYSDCKLEEGVTMRDAYDSYKDFAIYAKSVGDTVGRKLIVPNAGYDGDADFIRLLYTSSISAMGVNGKLYWDEINGSEADKNLSGFSCSNPREYVGLSMR